MSRYVPPPTITLTMDQDAADFYIGMFDDYIRKHPKERRVLDDATDLRRQYDLAFPDEND